MSSAKKVPAKKAAAQKPAAKKAPAAKVAAKKAPVAAKRADFGAPVDAFYSKQPAPLRAILDPLRALIEKTVPGVAASLKWGMPFYAVGPSMGEMVCAVGAHKAHVNLVLPGPEGTYADPEGLLEGAGKTGKHVTLRPGAPLPTKALQALLRVAAERARAGLGERRVE